MIVGLQRLYKNSEMLKALCPSVRRSVCSFVRLSRCFI